MPQLSARAESLPRSGIREIMEMAAGLEGVRHLEVGEPSFNTPAHIIDAAAAAAHAHFTKYTPNVGLLSLREAIAAKYTADWGRPVGTDEIVVTAGGVNAIISTVLAICDPGDEILIPDPGWPNYMSIAGVGEFVPVRYPMPADRGFLPDVRQLETLVTSRTRVLILNNPGNPTGVVLPAEVVRDLVDLARRHSFYVVADEIYEALVFDGDHTPASSFDTDGRVITVSGFSKTYAMTGWRLGYAIGHPAIVKLAAKVNESMVSCAPAVSQKAGEAALLGSQACVAEMKSAYKRRRDMVRDTLGPAGVLPATPSGAFYALIDLRATGMSSRPLALALLQEERIAVAPGDTFGSESEGMVRLSLASSDDDIAYACQAVLSFLQRHSGARDTADRELLVQA